MDFWLRAESIDLWKITLGFYNNFSDFDGGRGNVPAFPPPDATDIQSKNLKVKIENLGLHFFNQNVNQDNFGELICMSELLQRIAM